MKEIKSNPSKIINVYMKNNKTELTIVTNKDVKKVKLTEIPIMDRYSNGSYVVKDKIITSYIENNDIEEDNNFTNEKSEKNKEPNLGNIDEKIMTIDDLLNNIE